MVHPLPSSVTDNPSLALLGNRADLLSQVDYERLAAVVSEGWALAPQDETVVLLDHSDGAPYPAMTKWLQDAA